MGLLDVVCYYLRCDNNAERFGQASTQSAAVSATFPFLKLKAKLRHELISALSKSFNNYPITYCRTVVAVSNNPTYNTPSPHYNTSAIESY